MEEGDAPEGGRELRSLSEPWGPKGHAPDPARQAAALLAVHSSGGRGGIPSTPHGPPSTSPGSVGHPEKSPGAALAIGVKCSCGNKASKTCFRVPKQCAKCCRGGGNGQALRLAGTCVSHERSDTYAASARAGLRVTAGAGVVSPSPAVRGQGDGGNEREVEAGADHFSTAI